MNSRRDILKPFEQNREYMEGRIATGIEEHRKGYAVLRIKDAQGNPVPGAHVEIRQKEHEFKHGMSIFLLDEMESAEKNEAYKTLFKGINNLATLPFYWRDLEPEKGKPRFAKDSPKVYRRPAPDLCLEFCEANGITPKAHCLMYDQFTPDWVPDETGAMKYYLQKRFAELAERYAGRIPGWEVTNETFCHGRTVFFEQPELVEWSFETAKRYFPLNELIINEASGFIWDQFKYNRSQYYMQIERALGNGARIDAIGMQYHMFFRQEDEPTRTANYYNPRRLFAVADLYAQLGLPLQVTEVTVPAYAATEADEQLQAEILENLYRIWFASPQMEAIIYWNLCDGYAFRAEPGDMTSGENYYYGGLVRFDGTPKPAYHAIRRLFYETWRTNASIGSDEGGCARFKGFYGAYDVAVTVDGVTRLYEINFTKKGADSFSIVV